MDKQEILDEINKTKEHLANMEKMLEECDYERWKPIEDENYWYINGVNSVTDTCFIPSSNDIKRFNNYNCFKTKEQAKSESEKILVRRMLENIARRLNKGQKIDWNNDNQYKWYINHNPLGVATYTVHSNKVQGAVYCLDESFKDVAIQEIGEERLKAYLRGE